MGGMGRPSEYKPEHAEIARLACKYGATDEEIASEIGVSEMTINNWKLKHDDFAQALGVGKEYADKRVERSLYNKANGFYVTEEQALKLKDPDGSERIEVVEVKKYIPADTTSIIFWLKNRKRIQWSDRKDISIEANLQVEHKTLDPALLSDEQRELLKGALQQMMLPPPVDGEYDEVD